MAVNIATGELQYILVAIANDEVWYEDLSMADGTMVELAAATGTIDVTKPVSLFGMYAKGFVVNSDVFKVVDFGNVKLTHAALATAHKKGDKLKQDNGGSDAAYMIVDFTNAAKTATYGHAYYTGDTTAFVVTTPDIVAVEGGTGSTFAATAVTNPPHWYDWTPYPTVGTISYGTMPEKATLGCAYRGRAVLSGNPLYPYQWYMSRQANPWDWAYAASDAQSPVAGSDADAGQLGDTVTCLAPYQDDYLIIGCATTIWVLRGDPAAGGSLDQLSHSTGIFGAKSYCWDANNNFYFWGESGLYRIPSGLGNPELLTGNRLPNIISDESISPLTHRITLAYDKIRIGIIVSIVTAATGENSNYWYNALTDGFFPEEYPVQCAPYSMVFHSANEPSKKGLLVGGTDGYIRQFDETAKSDDIAAVVSVPEVVAIESKAVIGPGAISKDADSRGRMKTLSITTGSNTDGVSYDIYVNDTAEQVVDSISAVSTPLHTGTIAGPNRVQKLRPRSRGSWMGIVLTNLTVSETWSFEKAVADIKPAGAI